MGEESRKTELLVGLFLLIGIALLAILVLQFSGVQEALKEKYALTVKFPSAAGLVQGAPVKLGGATIGEISRRPQLNETFNGVNIELEIFSEYQIPTGSEFLVGTSGLMGDKLMEIRPPKPEDMTGTYVSQGSVLEGGGASGFGAIEDAAVSLTAKTQVVLADVEVALERLTSAISSLDSGFLGEKNAMHFAQTLSGLDAAISKIDQNLLADENLEHVKGMVAGFRETADNLKTATESVGPALAKIGPTIEKLEPSIAKLEGTLDEFSEAAEEIKGTALAATAVIGEFEQGDGLLPALVSDPQLKSQFSGLVSNFKRHGVLGYRDSAPKYVPPGNSVPAAETSSRPSGTNRANPDSRRKGWFPFFRKN